MQLNSWVYHIMGNVLHHEEAHASKCLMIIKNKDYKYCVTEHLSVPDQTDPLGLTQKSVRLRHVVRIFNTNHNYAA